MFWPTSGSRWYSFKPSIRQRKYSFLNRGSIHTKRKHNHQGKWDHQHLFYKLDSMSSIFLRKSLKQNIFLCLNWILCSLSEQCLPFFFFFLKEENPWKNLFHPKQCLSFHCSNIFLVAIRAKAILSAKLKCSAICNHKNTKNFFFF